MEQTAFRTKLEEVIRAFIKCPMEVDPEGDVFITIKGEKGADIELVEQEGVIDLEFGFAGEAHEFSGSDNEDMSSFKYLVQSILDLIAEKKFAARYKNLIGHTEGLFPESDFEKLKSKKGFQSLSWNGKYTVPG